ncbi:hypothetical protein ACQY0O_005693 [Thecaphora frezii]
MASFAASLRNQARSLLQAASTASTPSRATYGIASTSRLQPAYRSLATTAARSDLSEKNKSTYNMILDSLNDGLRNNTKGKAYRPTGDTVDYASDLEGSWALRRVHGEESWPSTPHSGRSVVVAPQSDPARAYSQLAALLRRNNVRNELRLQQRYEKPNEEKRRKKSERHRRRFADMVRKKVQLVMAIKARGA